MELTKWTPTRYDLPKDHASVSKTSITWDQHEYPQFQAGDKVDLYYDFKNRLIGLSPNGLQRRINVASSVSYRVTCSPLLRFLGVEPGLYEVYWAVNKNMLMLDLKKLRP